MEERTTTQRRGEGDEPGDRARPARRSAERLSRPASTWPASPTTTTGGCTAPGSTPIPTLRRSSPRSKQMLDSSPTERRRGVRHLRLRGVRSLAARRVRVHRHGLRRGSGDRRAWPRVCPLGRRDRGTASPTDLGRLRGCLSRPLGQHSRTTPTNWSMACGVINEDLVPEAFAGYVR